MADYRYDVNHEVSYNELNEIRSLLTQLHGEDTCTVIIDAVDNRNADRVIAAIDEDMYTYFTKGIGENNDTQVIIKRK